MVAATADAIIAHVGVFGGNKVCGDDAADIYADAIVAQVAFLDGNNVAVVWSFTWANAAVVAAAVDAVSAHIAHLAASVAC